MLTRATGVVPSTGMAYSLWIIENPATGRADNAIVLIGQTIGQLRPIGAEPVSERVLRETGTALTEAGERLAAIRQAADDAAEVAYERMVDAGG